MKPIDKLTALRRKLTAAKLAGFIQPVHDEYMSEYPPASNRRAEYLSGFSGSAGTVVVLDKKAALFTDGRYTLQAKAEVNGTLFQQYNSGETQPDAWITGNVPEGAVIGYDAKLYPRDAVRRMEARLKTKKIILKPVANPVDAIWEKRPAAPASPVFVHEKKYTGETSANKRKAVAERLIANSADALLVTAPDAVCWLLNIRAADVEGAPLVLTTAMVMANGKAVLFIDPKRCSKTVQTHLGKDVSLVEPEKMQGWFASLKGKRVQCDALTVPVYFLQELEAAGASIAEGTDPCLLLKSVKNETELAGICEAHVRDGVAVTRLLCWLDKEAVKRAVTESEVCDRLLAYREQDASFCGPSFNTISGSGGNGAIVHYRVSPATDRALKKGELFLLDSGGQYPDGTTDITRTVPIGKPSKEQKENNTRVLRGHIAIAMAEFPEGTTGSQLDALARQYLWQAGLDYDHGTGHGVGHFLNVHEGPQRISKRGGDAPLKPGMIVSNEPGYYKSGEYGIRIENLVAVIALGKKNGREFYGFETLTSVPIDTRLAVVSMLSEAEKTWLNQYHAWVYQNLEGYLDKAEREWLKERCKKI